MTSNNIGLPLGRNYTVISDTKVLNKTNGSVSEIKDVLHQNVSLSSSVVDASIAKQVEVVVGIDGKKIDFSLTTSEGSIEPIDGYLIEVYLSGADGVLTRVYKEDVVDVVNDATLSEGFSNYLVLQLDDEQQ